MIGTSESKQQQLANGYYQTGNGNVQILLLGSCRTLSYLSYLKRWNDANGDRFTIRRIDACDWNWDQAGNTVDIHSVLGGLETDERILRAIRHTDIFIHEHLESYGILNTDKTAEKNIYQFKMRPNHDIAIPNYHDHFILEHDYTACGIQTPDDYIQKGEEQVEKFCEVCMKSSFPEFGEIFRQNWRELRYFWRPNHVSALFTLDIFGMMNAKFLNLPLNDEFWDGARTEDLFKEPHTQVSQRDIEGYKLKWSG